jgi:hypothetical protein
VSSLLTLVPFSNHLQNKRPHAELSDGDGLEYLNDHELAEPERSNAKHTTVGRSTVTPIGRKTLSGPGALTNASPSLKYFPGKPLTLLVQSHAIQKLVRIAMEKVNMEILFTDAFPSDGKRMEISRQAVARSAQELRMANVLQRIRSDPSYLGELAKMVCTIGPCVIIYTDAPSPIPM